MYQNRKNVTKATPHKARCAGRMPQTSVSFVAVVPVGTAVKFISGDGSLHGASFLPASLNPNATISSARASRNQWMEDSLNRDS